jgi:uncharacterized protein (DUF1501 family)
MKAHSMDKINWSRRQLLRAGAGASLLGAAAPFGLSLANLSNAMAQQAPDDYRALVCVFQFGGNDGHDTLLATDAATWAHYSDARGSKALQQGQVLPLSLVAGSRHEGQRGFALHPSLAPLQSLFDGVNGDPARRHLAFVPNVGTLLSPTTKAQYLAGSVPVPPMLFSHNDQFNMWQSGQSEGASRGWGGLFGDNVLDQNTEGAVFTCISTAGNTVWLAGVDAVQYHVMPGTANAIPIEGRDSLFGSVTAGGIYSEILQREGGIFESEYKKVVQRSIAAEQTVNTAVESVTVGESPVAAGFLGLQLRAVARVIKAASTGALPGVKRQVFFVSAPGYDTHNNQFSGAHAGLLNELAEGLRYFHDELGDGLIDQVTTFTGSDFGRTLANNFDGTDHGWGGHHLVMGGAVKGGEVYGEWPDLSPGSNDLVELGRILLPRIAVDQYSATLGKWFGLTDQKLRDVFPNLNAFPINTHPHDLGFLKST